MHTVCTYVWRTQKQTKQTKIAYTWARVTPSIAQGKYPVYGLFLEVGDTFTAHSLGVFSNEAVSFWFVHFSVFILFFNF